MQILEIVLYSKRGQKRVISLKAGLVNIITGDSATGKSSLSTIVDYCLGRETFLIPEGTIRRNVSWFGLLLQFPNDQMFIARENPPLGKTTTNGVYIEQGDLVHSPEIAPPVANTTIAALKDTLTNKIGIAPNLHTPSPGQTRDPVSATIRHTLFYCIQEQGEIAAKGLLFHRQAETFIPQTIKDTLPYFLGAIQEDQLALEQELSRARLDLRRARKALKDIEAIQGEGENKARALLIEASEVGLIAIEETPQKLEDIAEILRGVLAWNPQEEAFVGSSRLTELQEEVKTLQNQFNDVSIALRDAVAFAKEVQGYASEMRQQELRLASIGLFESHIHDSKTCPICSQSLTVPIPTADAIRASIEHLQANLRVTQREQPKLREYIDSLEQQRSDLRQNIRERNEAIRSILQHEDAARQLRDTNALRMRVIGRISLWSESINASENASLLQTTVRSAEIRVATLEKQLDAEDKEERLMSILNRIGRQMSQWSQELKLEYSDNPVRLDLKKLTVVVDTEDGALPLVRIGSAQNWLGYHLTTLLALHKHFCQQSRPVPHFLFLDQPSQVYYPPDQDMSKNDSLDKLSSLDREALRRVFNLIFNVVDSLASNFQVIVTEHADLKDDDRFQSSIVERWRRGAALIPQEWSISDS